MFHFSLQAQEIRKTQSDTLITSEEVLKTGNDSIKRAREELKKSTSKNAVESKIDYKATDSIRIEIDSQRVYLYRDVEVRYQDITLKAGYIMMDFNTNTLYASGIPDSAGNEIQTPVFTQGSQSFTAKSMYYNFRTKKGLIKNIITQEGESYLHGKTVKRFSDNVTNIKNGKYTTCSNEHPHFEIRFQKAKVVPNHKIFTGPAYLVVEDVPTLLAIPFGFFPNKKGQVSGILMPRYGQSANRGFFFEDGGYYWGINDYIDLAVKGDIYTRGSWGVKLLSNYKKRYRFEGNFDLRYSENVFGERELPGYRKEKGFFIRWQHRQDVKARPNSSFSANVNAGSSTYNKYNATNAEDYLSNDFESSIAYQTSFARGRCNFAGNLGFKQNTGTHQIVLNAPELSFSVNRFYPFRKKNKTRLRWWDNISINYVMSAANRLNTVDSLFWNTESLRRMQNGMMHTIPVSGTFKIFRYFSWTNTFNYTERWYLKTIEKSFVQTPEGAYQKTDTIERFATARDFYFSSQLTTKIYAVYAMKKGALKAVRHVMTPILGFNYRPDFGTPLWGYYKYSVKDIYGNREKYSRFQNGIYGSPPDGKSGKVGLALSNNLEMKVRSRKDTLSGVKKIRLIDDLTIRSGYDLAKDSMNWDDLNLVARTRLFDRIDVTYTAFWDPYAIDSNGNRIKKTEWQVNRRLFRPKSYQWNFSVGFSLSAKDFKRKKTRSEGTESPQGYAGTLPPADRENPWNLNISYNIVYSSTYNNLTRLFIKDTTHALSVSGNIAITRKWNFSFTTNYDFVARKFSYTSINITRDLHCWEMILNWIPMGFRQSYNFTLRVKSPILQDLKLTKKTDWRDFY